MKISGWGKYPIVNSFVSTPSSLEDLINTIKIGNGIARGNGRSYGDSAISSRNTIEMKKFNRMLEFNSTSGLLVLEAGVILEDVINIFLPKGWFPPVTPGSKFVTIGGMVAADVHGKNHHKDGSFSSYIDWIDVITSGGQIKRCSRKKNKKIFNWTIGGMGLTGVVLHVAFKLKPVSTSWIKQKTYRACDIDQAIKIFEANLDSPYTVAWIDCLSKGKGLGRSLVILGEHATINDLPKNKRKKPFYTSTKRKMTIPINFPSFTLNKVSVKIFNWFYYWKASMNNKISIVDYESFFYPLDRIIGWNKIYGRKGFAQFQCVIPLKYSNEGIKELLQEISKQGLGSFLAVLKRFGKQESFFSFPMEGYTLALDFPISKNSLLLMKQLDEITIKYKGRLYLAKDSRMSPTIFKKSEKRLDDFLKYRLLAKNDQIFVSHQSKRLQF